jgi:hypothetical protein
MSLGVCDDYIRPHRVMVAGLRLSQHTGLIIKAIRSEDVIQAGAPNSLKVYPVPLQVAPGRRLQGSFRLKYWLISGIEITGSPFQVLADFIPELP